MEEPPIAPITPTCLLEDLDESLEAGHRPYGMGLVSEPRISLLCTKGIDFCVVVLREHIVEHLAEETHKCCAYRCSPFFRCYPEGAILFGLGP